MFPPGSVTEDALRQIYAKAEASSSGKAKATAAARPASAAVTPAKPSALADTAAGIAAATADSPTAAAAPMSAQRPAEQAATDARPAAAFELAEPGHTRAAQPGQGQDLGNAPAALLGKAQPAAAPTSDAAASAASVPVAAPMQAPQPGDEVASIDGDLPGPRWQWTDEDYEAWIYTIIDELHKRGAPLQRLINCTYEMYTRGSAEQITCLVSCAERMLFANSTKDCQDGKWMVVSVLAICAHVM